MNFSQRQKIDVLLITIFYYLLRSGCFEGKTGLENPWLSKKKIFSNE